MAKKIAKKKKITKKPKVKMSKVKSVKKKVLVKPKKKTVVKKAVRKKKAPKTIVKKVKLPVKVKVPKLKKVKPEKPLKKKLKVKVVEAPKVQPKVRTIEENKVLGYLEDALKRIDAGTYGICVECVEEPQFLCETCPLVPKARLEAVPHSQLCLPMKQKQERNR